jgi:NTE family protein
MAGRREPRRGLVLGCGGTVGGAWAVGALAAVADWLEWDPRQAEVIVGTSSGASIAAMLGAGISPRQLLAAQRGQACDPPWLSAFFAATPGALPPVPRLRLTSPRLAPAGLRDRDRVRTAAAVSPRGRGRASFLDVVAARCAGPGGWVQHPGTWLVAVDLGSGERVAFGSPGAPGVPLREALHASWAVPGWYRPVRAAGTEFADGGMASSASADLLAGLSLDEVVLIAPMVSQPGVRGPGLGGRAESLLRTPMSRRLEREVAALQAAGTRVLRVHPGRADLTVMGANFMNGRRRLAAAEAGWRSVSSRLAVQPRQEWVA